MQKNFGKEFCELDKDTPLYGDTLTSLGNISDFLGKDYPCDDIYRYWVFRNFRDEKVQYYAFWDLGNGWWSGEYFVADDLVSLWKELKANAGFGTRTTCRYSLFLRKAKTC